jgi:hypothetical protein
VIKPGVREDEFYRLADEDSGWEYLDGRLVRAPASDRHENLFRFLLTLLSGYLDACLDVRRGRRARGPRHAESLTSGVHFYNFCHN